MYYVHEKKPILFLMGLIVQMESYNFSKSVFLLLMPHDFHTPSFLIIPFEMQMFLPSHDSVNMDQIDTFFEYV